MNDEPILGQHKRAFFCNVKVGVQAFPNKYHNILGGDKIDS